MPTPGRRSRLYMRLSQVQRNKTLAFIYCRPWQYFSTHLCKQNLHPIDWANLFQILWVSDCSLFLLILCAVKTILYQDTLAFKFNHFKVKSPLVVFSSCGASAQVFVMYNITAWCNFESRSTKTCLYKYTVNFTPQNWKFSDKKFWYFLSLCSKHRLWVLVRTALTSRF